MARKYVNPNRALDSGAHPHDHEPLTGEHRHAHPLFGDSLSHEHSHYGEGSHARIAAAMAGTIPPRHVRFANGENRIMASLGAQSVMARARFGVPELPPAGDEPPPGAALDKHEWAANWGSFLNAVRDENDRQGARLVIRNAGMSERIPAEGGFLVPESLRQQVLFYLAGSIIRPRAMVIPAETLRTGLPMLDNPDQSGGQQGLGGIEFALVPEGKPIPATEGKFGRVVLSAQKIAAYLQGVPNELLSDASEAMGDLLARVIGLGYGWFVDDLAINGTGAGEPEGLMYCPAAYAVTRAASDEVLHADVVGMAKGLHPASKATATWLASEDVFDYLLELYEVTGTAPSGQDLAPPQSLKFNSAAGRWELIGLPIEVSDHQPPIGTPGDLMLTDLSLYVIAERQAMEVELSSQGSGFASGTTDIRIKGRLDGRYWPRSVYTLRNGRQCSPLVVLN